MTPVAIGDIQRTQGTLKTACKAKNRYSHLLLCLHQRADDYYSQRADDDDQIDILKTQVSHMQLPTNGEKYHVNHDENTLHKMVYGPTYVPYNEDGQNLLLPQTTDMSRKENVKLLYNSLPEGMCDNE